MHDKTKYAVTLLLLVMLFRVVPLSAQVDYNWWNRKHNWDGTTHWTQYMILSPGYMGPNALPVPELHGGHIPQGHTIETGLEGHYTRGDQTANLYFNYNFPLFTDKATFSITYRPMEIYRTDTMTRDERFSREYQPSGYSLGDVYFSTFIQLLQGHARLPDVMLSGNLKTASGTNLPGARHTDTPGYWFDATIGKAFSIQKKALRGIRIYGKAGFYAYQTFQVNHFQNDAFLFGAGISASLNRVKIHQQLTGYTGYFNNGDRPVVYRLMLESTAGEKIKFRLRFQQGLHDNLYSSIRLSILLKLNKLSNPSH